MTKGDAGKGRRFWKVLIGVLVLAGLFAAAWVVALEFQSPAQREASATPPEPEPIYEPVAKGRLADEVHVQATVGAARRRPITPAAVPAGAVVTNQLMRNGDKIVNGDALVEVNGRPVIVLEGDFAFYRDLSTGASGPDVTQLQEALNHAGYTVGEWEKGTFGSSTTWALQQLYSDYGYDVLRNGPECDEESSGGAPASGGGDDEGEGDQADSVEPTCEDPGWLLPRSELAIVSDLPAKLGQVKGVGSQISDGDAIGSLVSGRLIARATLLPETAARVTEGMSAELVDDAGGVAPATVKSIGGGGSEQGEQNELQLVIVPDEKLGGDWNGSDVLGRIIVEVASDDALIVPSVAMSRTPQGVASVVATREGGAPSRVEVRVLGELTGQAAVAPADDGALVEGDMVMVGDSGAG